MRAAKRRSPRAGAMLAIAAAVGLGASTHSANAVVQNVTVNNTVIGVTPRYLGFNMGHYMPNSNTTGWLQYSGTNGYRVWVSANDYEGGPPTGDDSGTYGDGITTQAQFDAQRTAVRANPETTPFINWTAFNNNFQNLTQSGRNHVKLNYILGELQKTGVEPIFNMTRSESYSYSGWGGKWEQWQFAYVMAYHAAKNYDVQRFQWYNEPNQSGSSITPADYTDRLKVTSDAVKAAVADVNRIYGKSLIVNMSAPTAINGATASTIDTWGKPFLETNHTDFEGNTQSAYVVDTFDVHRYNATGSQFDADVATVTSKTTQYNGAALPTTFTEFNRYNTSTFSGSSNNLDTPLVYAEYATDYIGAMQQNAKGMYAFKFNQTVWDDPGFSEPMKTGHYFVQDYGNNDISGATQGAEVARLITKGFKNERNRLGASVGGTSQYDWAASIDQGRKNYHYLSVNRNTSTTYDAAINLSAWDVQPGQIISIQEVSPNQHGSVPQFITVPANKTINISQPATSVWLMTIPSGAPQAQVVLNPTADAQVSHLNPSTNMGGAATAMVDRNSSTVADDAAYLRFNLGSTARANVGRAFLQLTGQNIANSTSTTLHAYAVLEDPNPVNKWSELGINWNNAPGLAGAADARLTGVGTTAFPAGQLTWNNTLNEWGIDVTELVRKYPDSFGDLSFAILREERFLGDSDSSQIQLKTREAASGQPKLTLMLYPNATYFWNSNFNGNFSNPSNWDAGVPGGVGAAMVMGDFPTSPRTVTMNAAATVGSIEFDNYNKYTLTGTSVVTLNAGAASTSAINVYKGSHTLATPINLVSGTILTTDAGTALSIDSAISGAAPLTKNGAGALTITAASPSFSGGITINAGSVKLTAVDSNFISGVGTGPVVVNAATLELSGITLGTNAKPGPDLTLNNGATLATSGASSFSKSTSPMIGNSGSVNITTLNAGDTFTIQSAFRNVTAGASTATVNVSGNGRVILQGGVVSPTSSYSGSWALGSGILQLGPSNGASNEALNALGYKNADPKQANAITITGGTLVGAVNVPQNGGTTPSFFRAGVTLSGGAIASSGLNASFGGDFTVSSGSISRVFTYDPISPANARDVTLAGGAATSLANAATTNWIGTLEVNSGPLLTGGAFNINRTGGTVNVTPGAQIVIQPGATVNLGGAGDGLSDGVDFVNVLNNSPTSFNVTTGTKNVGNIDGFGKTSVSQNATMIASHIRQDTLVANGVAKVRDNGGNAGTSVVGAITIGANGKIDLRDNDLIVTASTLGSWNGSAYTGVTGLVAKGRNGGTQNGNGGIVTSMSNAIDPRVLTNLAVVSAQQAGVVNSTWSGQPIGASDILVMYTYGGDANVDGILDGDDYFQIDSHINAPGPVGYSNGDFNYDGSIDGDDYFIIDSNINVGGTPMGGFAAAATTPVPEPAGSVIAALGIAVSSRRRRR